MELVDIHSHILPNMDDGARDIEQSLAMAKIACRGGISVAVATPHVIKGLYENRKADILRDVQRLNDYLQLFAVKLTILPGAEYYLEPDLPRRLAAGELLTINDTGRYILIELPATMIPDYTSQVFYEMQIQGTIPIIAHPERNPILAENPGILEDWSRRGILAQVTSGSIMGKFGRGAKKTAVNFLQTGAAQIVATDAHDARGRAPRIYEAYEEIQVCLGFDQARRVVYTNPSLIAKGQPLKPVLNKTAQNSWADYLKKFQAASINRFRL